MSSNGTRTLTWERSSGAGWSTFWQSRDIYGADPHVEISDFNGDGTADLYWSLRFEDIVGGGFVLDIDGTPRELPLMIAQCAEPVLERNGKSVRLRAYEPGVYSAEDCTDLSVASLCASDAASSWPKLFRVANAELVEEPLTRATYRELSTEYRANAERLDSLYAANAMLPGSSVTFREGCTDDLPNRFRQLADSASALGS